jgi:hypothetical protein
VHGTERGGVHDGLDAASGEHHVFPYGTFAALMLPLLHDIASGSQALHDTLHSHRHKHHVAVTLFSSCGIMYGARTAYDKVTESACE